MIKCRYPNKILAKKQKHKFTIYILKLNETWWSLEGKNKTRT